MAEHCPLEAELFLASAALEAPRIPSREAWPGNCPWLQSQTGGPGQKGIIEGAGAYCRGDWPSALGVGDAPQYGGRTGRNKRQTWKSRSSGWRLN